MKKLLKSFIKLFRQFIFNYKYNNYFKSEAVHTSFVCDNFKGLSLGEKVYIGPYCHFDARGTIELHDYCIIAPHVKIWSYNHDFKSEMIPYGNEDIYKKVVIGKGCWIGLGATILPGSTIGEGAIIGAGSVVSGNIPPFTIVRPPYAIGEPIRINKTEDLYQRKFK